MTQMFGVTTSDNCWCLELPRPGILQQHETVVPLHVFEEVIHRNVYTKFRFVDQYAMPDGKTTAPAAPYDFSVISRKFFLHVKGINMYNYLI